MGMQIKIALFSSYSTDSYQLLQKAQCYSADVNELLQQNYTANTNNMAGGHCTWCVISAHDNSMAHAASQQRRGSIGHSPPTLHL